MYRKIEPSQKLRNAVVNHRTEIGGNQGINATLLETNCEQYTVIKPAVERFGATPPNSDVEEAATVFATCTSRVRGSPVASDLQRPQPASDRRGRAPCRVQKSARNEPCLLDRKRLPHVLFHFVPSPQSPATMAYLWEVGE